LEEDLLGSITMRCSIKFLQEIKPLCGRGKKYSDVSAAIRYYIERGRQFENLLEIYNNPELRSKFEGTLKRIAEEKDLEKYFETIDPKLLDSIIFVAKNKKDAKIKQLLLSLK